jgi:hypothetical protein
MKPSLTEKIGIGWRKSQIPLSLASSTLTMPLSDPVRGIHGSNNWLSAGRENG